MKDFVSLEKSIGIVFKDQSLLRQAFCHRSYLNEHPDFTQGHNERLEFLGDAVLELSVTRRLYQNYPEKPEGELTSWRAALVNAKMLSRVAQELGFDDFLLLSQGEAKEKGKARQYILANTFEALVGAVYLDQGFEAADEFIQRHLIKRLPSIIENNLFRNAKSYFQEKAQETEGVTPAYRVLKEWGPDHERHFLIGVFLDRAKIAEGEGASKQEAEEAAAAKALEARKWSLEEN